MTGTGGARAGERDWHCCHVRRAGPGSRQPRGRVTSAPSGPRSPAPLLQTRARGFFYGVVHLISDVTPDSSKGEPSLPRLGPTLEQDK